MTALGGNSLGLEMKQGNAMMVARHNSIHENQRAFYTKLLLDDERYDAKTDSEMTEPREFVHYFTRAQLIKIRDKLLAQLPSKLISNANRNDSNQLYYRLGAIFESLGNFEQAEFCFQKAAAVGHAASCARLGNLLAKKNPQQAMLWLHKATAHYPRAYWLKAICMPNIEPEVANEYLAKGAEAGCIDAQYEISRRRIEASQDNSNLSDLSTIIVLVGKGHSTALGHLGYLFTLVQESAHYEDGMNFLHAAAKYSRVGLFELFRRYTEKENWLNAARFQCYHHCLKRKASSYDGVDNNDDLFQSSVKIYDHLEAQIDPEQAVLLLKIQYFRAIALFDLDLFVVCLTSDPAIALKLLKPDPEVSPRFQEIFHDDCYLLLNQTLLKVPESAIKKELLRLTQENQLRNKKDDLRSMVWQTMDCESLEPARKLELGCVIQPPAATKNDIKSDSKNDSKADPLDALFEPTARAIFDEAKSDTGRQKEVTSTRQLFALSFFLSPHAPKQGVAVPHTENKQVANTKVTVRTAEQIDQERRKQVTQLLPKMIFMTMPKYSAARACSPPLISPMKLVQLCQYFNDVNIPMALAISVCEFAAESSATAEADAVVSLVPEPMMVIPVEAVIVNSSSANLAALDMPASEQGDEVVETENRFAVSDLPSGEVEVLDPPTQGSFWQRHCVML